MFPSKKHKEKRNFRVKQTKDETYEVVAYKRNTPINMKRTYGTRLIYFSKEAALKVAAGLRQPLSLAFLLFGLTGCGEGTRVDPWYEQIEEDIAALQAQNEALQALIDSQEPGVDLRTLDPCPAVDATFKEVLVCINDEVLLALYYDHNKKQSFFAELPPGNYVTTDSRKCKFVAGENCSVDQL